MTENTPEKGRIKDDEIDLLDLFNKMGRSVNKALKALWNAFLISLFFLLKRWIPLSISIILGVGVSYIYMKKTPSMYTSDMVLRNNVEPDLPNDQLISYINRLHSINKSDLSETLGISEVANSNIISISAFWIIDLNKDEIPDNVDYTNNHDIYDTTNIRMLDRIDIRIMVRSSQELDAVRDGIIKYINANPVFCQMNELRLQHKDELLNRTSMDIKQLDSLQKVKYFEETRDKRLKTQGQIVFVQEQGTQLLYPNIHTLLKEKQKLENEVGLYKGIVTVISDFSIPSIRVNGLGYYIRKNVPTFFVTMLLLLILIANLKKIKEVYHRY